MIFRCALWIDELSQGVRYEFEDKYQRVSEGVLCEISAKGQVLVNVEHIFRRILFSLITLAAVITFNFFLFRIVPGDPVAMIASPRMKPETRELIREQYGLDKPLWFNMEAMRSEGKLSAAFDNQF